MTPQEKLAVIDDINKRMKIVLTALHGLTLDDINMYLNEISYHEAASIVYLAQGNITIPEMHDWNTNTNFNAMLLRHIKELLEDAEKYRK